MKLISLVTPCRNEESNVEEVYTIIKGIFTNQNQYTYEHIFIDNASTDNTVAILKKIAEKDKNVKIIVNVRNYGPNRSPFYGLLQAKGDAVILFVADLQDPPELILEFINKWEAGHKVVLGIKRATEENKIIFFLRKIYYRLIKAISETEHIGNFSGFGLYDRSFINTLRSLNDPYPYFRGMVAEYGTEITKIEYKQPKRKRGKSSHSFLVLYDIAMLGFINHSKLPIRFASFIGFVVALISLFAAIGYFIYKLIFWDRFDLGVAPLVIGLFFFSSVQLLFLGIIGEYIGEIYTRVKNRPFIEKERVNFSP